MRLGCEAFVSRMVLFVTLTFSDENLSRAGGRTRGHAAFKQYMQNLRRAGHSVRYLGAFEFGEKTARPHYHAILCFGADGKAPDMPLNVRADLPHWTHGFSKYEIPRTRAGALQYTLGYVVKGGGEVLTPSNNFGKRFLLNFAEMQGRNNRPFVKMTKGHLAIPVRVAGMVVRKTGIDGNGMVKRYEFPVSHPWAGEMAGRYLDGYVGKFGKQPPATHFVSLSGDH